MENKKRKASDELNYDPRKKNQSNFNEANLKNINANKQIPQTLQLKKQKKQDLLQEYEQALAKYIANGITLQSQLFLAKMATNSKIPEYAKQTPLFKHLRAVATDLMLNELEIIVWAIYIDKFGWENEHFNIFDNLYLSAFAVKMYMNAEFAIFQAHLDHDINGFSWMYNKWIEDKVEKEITSFEINDKFIQLSQRKTLYACDFIDYNYAVDEILEVAPPPVGLGKEEYEMEVPMRKRENPKNLAKTYRKPLVNSSQNSQDPVARFISDPAVRKIAYSHFNNGNTYVTNEGNETQWILPDQEPPQQVIGKEQKVINQVKQLFPQIITEKDREYIIWQEEQEQQKVMPYQENEDFHNLQIPTLGKGISTMSTGSVDISVPIPTVRRIESLINEMLENDQVQQGKLGPIPYGLQVGSALAEEDPDIDERNMNENDLKNEQYKQQYLD